MESVPIKELKKDLSYWTEQAAQGKTIQITKYNRPYVVLTKSFEGGLYRGKQVGKGALCSLLNRATQGKYLKYLQEDRDSD